MIKMKPKEIFEIFFFDPEYDRRLAINALENDIHLESGIFIARADEVVKALDFPKYIKAVTTLNSTVLVDTRSNESIMLIGDPIWLKELVTDIHQREVSIVIYDVRYGDLLKEFKVVKRSGSHSDSIPKGNVDLGEWKGNMRHTALKK